MKIAVIGSRTFNNKEFLFSTLREYKISKIVSGGAIGADSLAEQYAKENNITFQKFLPDYKRHGRSAPIKRNDLIVDAADMVVAFWDGVSHGTKYTIDYAMDVGKRVVVYGPVRSLASL